MSQPDPEELVDVNQVLTHACTAVTVPGYPRELGQVLSAAGREILRLRAKIKHMRDQLDIHEAADREYEALFELAEKQAGKKYDE